MATGAKSRPGRLRDPGSIVAGLATLAAAGMAYLAFDDITTDNATSFTVEYLVLAGCAAVCLWVAIGLTRRRRRILGTVSLLMLAGALLGQRGIGPGTVPGWRAEYLATVGALIWFLALSVVLIVQGARMERGAPAQPGG